MQSAEYSSHLAPDQREGVGHHSVTVVEAAQYRRRHRPGSPGQHRPLAQPPGGDHSPLLTGGGVTTGSVQGETVEYDTVTWLTRPA